MNRHLYPLILLVCVAFSINVAADDAASNVPEPFRGFDANSKYVIDYTDLESLLDMVVLETGRSTREKATEAHAKTGTRMKVKVNRSTVNEGNRFYYEIFKGNKQNQQKLLNIRNRLENIPLQVPLEKFSRDEQLAYWLNLYNITILNEIARAYPKVNMEKMLVGRKSILARELLNVGGVPLSLNDVQFKILRQNYDGNPLIIYGLYQGIIGGPNIRKHAYTGKYVYADLIDNAMEFINSNRGTESKNEDVFRVSSMYERSHDFFAGSDAELRKHLLNYLEGKQREELHAATEIKADIEDWTVTSLFGSQREVGGSLAHSNAAMMGAVSGAGTAQVNTKAATGSRYSPAVLERLNELNRERERERTGKVTIEELGQVESEEDTVDDKSKE